MRWLTDLLPPICIVLGLSVTLAFQAAALAPLHADNERAFHSFSNGIEEYRDFKVAWRTRLLANFGAAEVARWNDRFAQQRNDEASALEWTIASWTVLWFALLGLMYVHAAGRRSIFYLFGTFSALLFGYTPSVERIYPWDLPIVVIFTAFLILYVRKKYWLIAAVLPLGMGFKETSAVLCLAFIFTEQSWTRRLVLLTVSLSACLAVKTAIDIYVDVPIPFFTMEYAREGGEESHEVAPVEESKRPLESGPCAGAGQWRYAAGLHAAPVPEPNRKGAQAGEPRFPRRNLSVRQYRRISDLLRNDSVRAVHAELFWYGDSCLDRSADQYETT